MEVQLVEKTEKPRPFQVVPSIDQAKLFVPEPPASHIWPFHAMAFTLVVNALLPPATAVKAAVPEIDDAMRFVPEPPARKVLPFHAIQLHCVLKIVAARPVQVIPLSLEYAMVFVPTPPATRVPPFQARALQLVEKVVRPWPTN
jgi:hypothetical protein